MDVHLIDGTYELFRHFYVVPAAQDVTEREIGAVRAVLRSVLSLIEHGATHIGVATDHVAESFRNDLCAGYKTSAGVPPTLLSQFPILEEALAAMAVMVWPMVEYEADDALASAAAKAAGDDRVRQVIICTPDKDLGQCVEGTRVVQLDRRRGILRDEAAVEAKFGVKPQSIPDYLAVLGDSADDFQVYLAGAKKPRLRPYRAIGTLRTFRETGESGIRRLAMRGGWPHRCSTPGMTLCSFGSSRLCGSMHPSLNRWTTFAGRDHGQALKNNAGLWGHLICSSAPLRLQRTPWSKPPERGFVG